LYKYIYNKNTNLSFDLVGAALTTGFVFTTLTGLSGGAFFLGSGFFSTGAAARALVKFLSLTAKNSN